MACEKKKRVNDRGCNCTTIGFVTILEIWILIKVLLLSSLFLVKKRASVITPLRRFPFFGLLLFPGLSFSGHILTSHTHPQSPTLKKKPYFVFSHLTGEFSRGRADKSHNKMAPSRRPTASFLLAFTFILNLLHTVKATCIAGFNLNVDGNCYHDTGKSIDGHRDRG